MKFTSCAAFLFAAGLMAQSPAPPPSPFSPGAVLDWAVGGLTLAGGNVVKNAPYSADAITETTQTLADGNRIVQRTKQKLYRDSDGRERREESLLALGVLAQPDGVRVITISDPVAGTAYTLDPDTRIARRTARVAISRYGLTNNYLTVVGNYTDRITARSLPAGTPSAREDLGTKNIEGVNAQGTRTTQTIPAGQVGNQFPIKIVDEGWYSPELQMNVMTTHNDPRTGEIVYKLTNISRANPAKSFFEVPSDYAIPTLPAGGGRGGRGTPGNPPAGGGRSMTPFGTKQ